MSPLWSAPELHLSYALFAQVLVFIAPESAPEFAPELHLSFCNLLILLHLSLHLTAPELVHSVPPPKGGALGCSPRPPPFWGVAAPIFEAAIFGDREMLKQTMSTSALLAISLAGIVFGYGRVKGWW